MAGSNSNSFIDPWRRHRTNPLPVAPGAPGAPGAAGSIKETPLPGEEQDVDPLDADLQPNREFLIRVPGASRALRIQNVSTLRGATERLHQVITKLPNLRKELEKVHVLLNQPRVRGTFVMESRGKSITVSNIHSAVEGFNVLTGGILIAKIKNPNTAKALQDLGVELINM